MKYTFVMVSNGTANDLKHAYRVLDVPWNASERTVKTSYRRLIKRWHPDRYPPGSDSYRESTLMTKLLNDAYGRIKDAPLRYGGVEGIPAKGPWAAQTTGPSSENEPSGSSRNEYVPRDASQDAAEYYNGFFVRFVLGALFGGVLSFKVIIYFYENPRLMHVAIVVTILFCAFASGFGGEAFWRSIRPGWRGW